MAERKPAVDSASLNIYQKLAKTREQVEIMKRSTKAYGYSYTKEEDILARITVCMKKYGFSLIPSITPGTLQVTPYSYKKTKTTAKGDIYEEVANEIITNADMVYTWVDNDNPDERVVVNWSMVGMQGDGSQSFGSGLTYSSRYFLLKYFNISTSNDDPDAFRSKQKEVEEEETRIVTEQIIQSVDEIVQAYIKEKPDDREKVKKVVVKYIKSGDYTKIKDSVLAGKLLQDVQKQLVI